MIPQDLILSEARFPAQNNSENTTLVFEGTNIEDEIVLSRYSVERRAGFYAVIDSRYSCAVCRFSNRARAEHAASSLNLN